MLSFIYVLLSTWKSLLNLFNNCFTICLKTEACNQIIFTRKRKMGISSHPETEKATIFYTIKSKLEKQELTWNATVVARSLLPHNLFLSLCWFFSKMKSIVSEKSCNFYRLNNEIYGNKFKVYRFCLILSY